MKYKGRVFYCSDKDLKIKNSSNKKGHYVIVRKEQGDKAVVRTITSLESNTGFKSFRINKVKYGLLKPIPMNETNLEKWSAINSQDLLVRKKDLEKTNKYIYRKNMFSFKK